MEIQFFVRNVYGIQKAYPANPAADTLAHLAGTTTLGRDTLALARRLGHTTTQVADPKAAPAFDADEPDVDQPGDVAHG